MDRLKQIIFDILFRQTVTISSDTSLRGFVVMITGASRGIGKSTAEVLVKQGAHVVLVARNMEELKKSSAKYAKSKKILLQADITSAADCERVVAETVNQFGKIDVLINNAGLFAGNALTDTSEKEWDRAVAVNMKGMFLMSKTVIPVMKKKKTGLIINIGSKVSRNTNISSKKVLYATTKYAVEGMSTALSKELRDFGIRVVCLMPGTVRTVRSLQAKRFLPPHRLGQVIANIIRLEDVDFETLVVKSRYQNI